MANGTGGGDGGLLERVDAGRIWRAGSKTKRWRHFLLGTEPEPIPAFRGPIEDPDPKAIGVCCSGGGVRSAAFNLGALQALQEKNVLRRARYVAAVSGGSYIAAALSMVAKTWDQPGDDDSNPKLIAEKPSFHRGSPEEQYLRNRSSYLAPSGMDKLYLASRIIVGVLFNFVFLGLPLFGIAVLLGVFFYRPEVSGLAGCTHNCYAHLPQYMWLVPVGFLAGSALVGLLPLMARIKDGRSRFLQIWSARLLVLSAVAAWFGVALPELVALLTTSASSGASLSASGIVGGSGLLGVLAGVFAHLKETVASPAKAIDELKRGRQWLAKLSSAARRILAYTVAALIGPALLLSTMVLGLSLAMVHSKGGVNGWLALWGALALVAFAAAYALVDLTSWSLHPFYKRRLCTAYALKRIRPSDDSRAPGYGQKSILQAENDGIAVERKFDNLVPLSETALKGNNWPTLIVCAAANISDSGATPPGRHVTSFTFSPHAIGGPLVGGVATKKFEDAFSNGRALRQKDFTLPAAVAMSGAALSPSMGKMTRRPLTFLMALANIRLGVWLPNPRWVCAHDDGDSWRYRAFGRARPSYLFCELLGHNRVDARYLYVSDGGHYENLGLVELLRRGCTRIYCFDASNGQEGAQLGDAIALARSELGVEIEIDLSDLTPSGDDNVAQSNVAQGSISYPDGPTGTLIYACNVMTADVPFDVKAYHKRDPRFPNDPTADQLYTDQKFEAYRTLGFDAGANAEKLMQRAQAGLTTPVAFGGNGHGAAGAFATSGPVRRS